MFKPAGRLIRGVCVVGAIIATIMLLIGGYDCSVSAGWGWDCTYLWVAPVVFIIAAIIFASSLAIERLFRGNQPLL